MQETIEIAEEFTDKWIFIEYVDLNQLYTLRTTIFDDFNKMKNFSAQQSSVYKQFIPDYNSTYYKIV